MGNCTARMLGTLLLMNQAPIATTKIEAAITAHQNGAAGTRVRVSAAAAASKPTYDQAMK